MISCDVFEQNNSRSACTDKSIPCVFCATGLHYSGRATATSAEVTYTAITIYCDYFCRKCKQLQKYVFFLGHNKAMTKIYWSAGNLTVRIAFTKREWEEKDFKYERKSPVPYNIIQFLHKLCNRQAVVVGKIYS